ncbi:MAG: BsuBI/PstI family type II restriction endonuclease [Candidatus Brocadiia bacterium]
MGSLPQPGVSSVLDQADFYRLDANRRLDAGTQAELGQFLTSPSVAHLMASMFALGSESIRFLDPGAGTGVLTAALIEDLCGRANPPDAIEAVGYELDDMLAAYLEETYSLCQDYCTGRDVEFHGEVRQRDFIEDLAHTAQGGLLREERPFDAVIMNPPYGKLPADSSHRRLVEQAGVRVPNQYAAFVAVAVMLLRPEGELVAIIPRSFCNGRYFRDFRRYLLRRLGLRRIHVFESREAAFNEADVLQENVILSGLRSRKSPSAVTITSSFGPRDKCIKRRIVNYGQVVDPEDPEAFVHLITDAFGDSVTRRVGRLRAKLADLGISVSTGPVVDFRHREQLQQRPGHGTVPLIYPCHLTGGRVGWPGMNQKKPNAFRPSGTDDKALVPEGRYVLVKRFSSKEERRRIVAAVYEPGEVARGPVAFENHLNYFHKTGSGLSLEVAWGLATYLNSTLTDQYFRLFSGHTQVNATDLRRLPYPTLAQLSELGRRVGQASSDQQQIDDLLMEAIPEMAGDGSELDPVQGTRKKEEAQDILRQLGLPPAQQNERSALTLLALLDIRPDADWQDATDPLRGITEMMDWFAEHYGVQYAPNTRETVRRQTVHQFVQAGIAQKNPDEPGRPTHSPHPVYQVTPQVLEAVRYYKTSLWGSQLDAVREQSTKLRHRHQADREMQKVPVHFDGKKLVLSPGHHSRLIRSVVEDFCPRFVPGGQVLYIDERGAAEGYVDEKRLQEIGVRPESGGRMPDVAVYDPERVWLVLVEAVTSHGPVNPTRRQQLYALFADAEAELVYVTAFPTRQTMTRYLSDISWETEVWVADAPNHMIHFNGERFLGPY